MMQKFGYCMFHNRQLGLCTHYGDLLQAGQFRHRILVEERFYIPSRLLPPPPPMGILAMIFCSRVEDKKNFHFQMASQFCVYI
jgi:hypothetical protein